MSTYRGRDIVYSVGGIFPIVVPLVLLFILLSPFPAAAQVPISFGQTITATISAPGELDLYSFQAEADDMVVVVMTTTTFLDPYVRLYGPDGSLLNTAYNANGPGVTGFLTAPLPTTGTYKVVVGDYGDGTETGSYAIFVQRTNNPGRANPIEFGETVSASIDAVGQCDTYTFNASAGDIVLVRMSTTSFLDPSISIYDPDGTWLGFWWNTGPGTVEFTTDALPKTGTYTLLVRDDQFNETGPYGIFVQRLNNPGETTPIGFGETISASISAAGEVDTYTFDAVAGDTMVVDMSTPTHLDPHIRLYDPDGVLVQEAYAASGPWSAPIWVTLPKTGAYHVLASDYGDGTETGEYGIYVQRLNNPGMATSVGFGETISASLDKVCDLDTYTFEALEGDIILARMSTRSYLDPELVFCAPDGSTLSWWYVGGPGTVEFTSDPLPATGTYKILAADSAASSTRTGDYWLSVQRLNNPGKATPIGFGETISASLDNPGEVDTYTFDAIAGDVVTVVMSTTTFLDPYVQVYGPDGSLLYAPYNAYGPGMAVINAGPLATSGTYKVLIADYGDGTETGDYGITIQRLNNPGKATPIGFGETISASISAVGEVDTYTFDAIAGDMALVRMSTASFLDPRVTCYDPEGNLVAYAQNDSGPGTAEFTTGPLPTSGTYTLTLRDNQANETGPYTVSLNVLAGTPGALSITPAQGLNSVGSVGGPFAPTSQTYTLKNGGTNSIQWALTKGQGWLNVDVSPQGDTLEPGQSVAVTVTINAGAGSLAAGTYTDTLTFTNLTQGNRTIIRSASLLVKPLEGILEVSPDTQFTISGPPHGPFDPSSMAYTLRNIGGASMAWKVAKAAYWLSLSADHGALQPGQAAEVTFSVGETATDLAQGVYRDRITFTNTSNGNGDAIRDVLLAVGVSPSQITCELSRSSIILGETLRVSGRITPAPSQAGAFVDVALIPPNGQEVRRTVVANALGQFTYDVACDDISQEGKWTVRAGWKGDVGLGAATSGDQSLDVAKAKSRVTVNATSQAVKFGDPLDISGKFTPNPDCGGDLSGIQVTLSLAGPDGGSDVRTVTTNDRWGHYVLQDYIGLTALGDWTFQAKFAGNDAYLPFDSDPVRVRVVETAGYAIVVQGKIANEEGLASHNKTANLVYTQLKQRGLLDDDIKYFNYDARQPGVDGIPSKTAVGNAITQWARDKMNAKPANLYIVMVDHGFVDTFYIHPDTISAAELGGWLTTLQSSLLGQAAQQEIIVILGFCRSGSFINDLSAQHRVIVASAAENESSYKGPLDKDGIREGEYFISEFFKGIAYGKSMKAGFEESAWVTRRFTSSGSGAANAPYHDDSWQHPLLDDNGDGVGSADLSDPTGDGALSRTLFIGVSSLTGNDPGDVSLTYVTSAVFLNTDQSAASLWARVDNNSRLDTLWIEIKPPGYTPLDPKGSGEPEMDLTRSVFDTTNEFLDRYEWNGQGGFVASGTYQIFYFAKDTTSGNVSPLMETTVYKAKAGNSPPQPFSLLAPADGETVLTTAVLDWEDATDPDGDPLTYTVLLSRGDPSFSNPIEKEGLTYSACLVSPGDGIEDLSDYYWKVQAIDQYGAVRETNVGIFHTNNTNPVAAWIKGHVYNALSGQSLANAVVSVGGLNLTTALGGYYLGQVVPGTYTMTTSANGYQPKSYAGVVIGDAELVTKDFPLLPGVSPGDINGDLEVGLADAILALQVVAGVQPAVAVSKEADINDDGRIGLEEAIYILQKAAGLR